MTRYTAWRKKHKLPCQYVESVARGKASRRSSSQIILGRTISVPALIASAGFVVPHVILCRTVSGRCVIAAGSNKEAARLAGIRVRRVKLVVYATTGGIARAGGRAARRLPVSGRSQSR